jgi:integrase
MSRRRFQRGTLRTSVPAHGDRPKRKLPRGEHWAQWFQYVRHPNGREKRRRREKIITRELAEKHGIANDYAGPLAKSDAQRVLHLLISQESGVYVPPDTAATVALVGKEYLALSEPNWGPHMVRGAGNLVTKHIINGTLGGRRIAELGESDLQRWINGYVNKGASHSLLKGLLLHTRAIWKYARKKRIITENPTEDLRAKSKRRVSERYLSVDECQRLLSVLVGRDHLIVRMAIQLGLRPEELFALRRNDVQGDQLRVDEALIEGQPGPVKTAASAAFVYVPPDLSTELQHWLECSDGAPTDYLFRPSQGRPARFLNANNYRERVLQPAAIRAKVGLIDSGKKDEDGNAVLKTEVDFRVLRRTCATLFGDVAKDPKSTQAQLRHADPSITLKHYQKAIPATVKAAAMAFEAKLGFHSDQVLNRHDIQ